MASEIDVINCARCGGRHKGLYMMKFTRPVVINEKHGWKFSHWALCPVMCEPFLIDRREKDEK